MLVEEILRPILKDRKVVSYSQLFGLLATKSNCSKTTKLWVDVLIKPLFYCLLFIRAEREGDWALHLEAVELMLPEGVFSGLWSDMAIETTYMRFGKSSKGIVGQAVMNFNSSNLS